MPKKSNPLGLNALQLRTLALFQVLARLPEHGTNEADGSVTVRNLPHPHGDHFHVGDKVVMAADATGLRLEAPWVALERKGLLRSGFPYSASLTEAGLSYETGLGDYLLHGGRHGSTE